MYYWNKSNVKWQKSYISSVFSEMKEENTNFTNKLLSDMDLLNSKSVHLPRSLFRFYPLTANNIIDIKSKKIWLSDPNSFNDPYDCNIGYNSVEYEKKELLKYLKVNGLIGDNKEMISDPEYWKLYHSIHTEVDYSHKEYRDVKREVLKHKSENFKSLIFDVTKRIESELDDKIRTINSQNIRVACFSGFDNFNDVNDKLEMWAHYADNHKGICVEYYISSLKQELLLKHHVAERFEKENECIEERINATIKCGLFPIIYTSNRVKMPYTKLLKVKDVDSNTNMINEKLYKSYITKSTKWSYEKEWRLLVDSKTSNYFSNKISFPFIKRIYLGCNVERHNLELLFDIANELDIEIYQMRMKSNKFSLDVYPLDDYYVYKNRYLNNWPYDV